jgi:Na+/H+ antiporter NhaD/arsenite permease-like protein
MLFALYTAAGGIRLSGLPRGSPLVNTAFLGIGAVLASFIGTTAVSMLLIRPLIEANRHRVAKTHIVIFFIFLVSNIGGALSPLGDPPLFLGFLNGVDFFWPLQTLWPETLFMVLILLSLFLVLDFAIQAREKPLPALKKGAGFRVTGLINLGLIALAVAILITSGIWRPGWSLEIFGVTVEAQNAGRDSAMVLIGLLSLILTKAQERVKNGFDWEPLREVAKLFAAIFICIIPVMAMLKAGAEGPFAALIKLLTTADGGFETALIFWTTGLLSSFLDNAPTYLVFFNIAGGDPGTLMGPLSQTLAAISLGAVFMGANTYIGNAPNFMVYAIARDAGVKMPSFFAYIGWSSLILIPLFAVLTYLFFD